MSDFEQFDEPATETDYESVAPVEDEWVDPTASDSYAATESYEAPPARAADSYAATESYEAPPAPAADSYAATESYEAPPAPASDPSAVPSSVASVPPTGPDPAEGAQSFEAPPLPATDPSAVPSSVASVPPAGPAPAPSVGAQTFDAPPLPAADPSAVPSSVASMPPSSNVGTNDANPAFDALGTDPSLNDLTVAAGSNQNPNPNPAVTRDLGAPATDITGQASSARFVGRAEDTNNNGIIDSDRFTRDQNQDGRTDVEVLRSRVDGTSLSTVDLDGDGRPDLHRGRAVLAADADGDGRPDVLDRNADNRFESKVTPLDLNRDGLADAVDIDGDGIADGKLEAVDLNGDGIADVEIITALDPTPAPAPAPAPQPQPAPKPEPIVLVREEQTVVSNTTVNQAPAPPPPPAPVPGVTDFASSLMGLEVGDGDEQVASLFREHGYSTDVQSDKSIADLNASLADGQKVFVALDRDELLGIDDDDSDGGNDANAVMELVSIDEAKGVVTLRSADGELLEVPLSAFEDAWEDADNSLVFGEKDDSSLTDGLLQPAIVLVPLAFAGGAVAIRGLQTYRNREADNEAPFES